MKTRDEHDTDLHTLSPGQRAEREKSLRAKKGFEDDIEERADFNAQLIMEETNPDATPDDIVRGKKMGGRRQFGDHNSVRRHERATIEEILALKRGGLLGFEILREIVESPQKFMDSLRTKFAASVPAPHKVSAVTKYEDALYEYDTVKVSPKTAAKLDAEIAEIHTRVDHLHTIKCMETRHVEAEKILVLAGKYNMRLHPKTRLFVHDIERVDELEERYNPRGDLSCTGVACYFRTKYAPGGDSVRGIKSKVADVMDNNPAEVNASGDHLKGHGEPLKAPELRHS